MGQTAAGTAHGLRCPDCATELEPSSEGSGGVLRLTCPGCGGKFRVSQQNAGNGRPPARVPAPLGLVTVGPVALAGAG